MSFKFKPEDFHQVLYKVDSKTSPSDIIAEIANTLLEKHVVGLPRWYGNVEHGLASFFGSPNPDGKPIEGDDHTAIIWSIEPIKRGCEKHEPDDFDSKFEVFCKHCGVKLVARWEAE